MKVKLISHTPEALKVAFTAIRTCYSPYDANYIMHDDWDKYVANNDDHIRLVKQIVSHGHTSTLEHINFTFSVEGVSRVLLAQMTRHRVGFSFSVQSQRYVKMSTDSKHGAAGYVFPDTIGEDSASAWLYKNAVETAQGAYDELVKRGVPAEDARYVLPNAATTNFITTFNLRAFMDFYSKRKEGTHAQWEIQELAETMRNQIVLLLPWTTELL